MDKKGFFVALKLVGLAQAGHDINMRNIFLDTPNPPKVVSCIPNLFMSYFNNVCYLFLLLLVFVKDSVISFNFPFKGY